MIRPLAVLVVPTIAPKIAETIGIPAGQVGFQISLLYLAAMFGSLSAGTWVARLGPCRTGQRRSPTRPFIRNTKECS